MPGNGDKVYLTQLLSERPVPGETRPLTQTEGADNGQAGRVTVIDADTNEVIHTVILNPLPDLGAAFKSDGNTLAREPLSTPPVFDNVTGAFPNLLESIVVRGNLAYVPGTCSSPNGPFRLNVNVQSCLSTIDTDQDAEAFGPGATLNLRDEVQDFTRNVRAVSGGGGLVRVDANGNPVPEGVARAAARSPSDRQHRPERHCDVSGTRGARPISPVSSNTNRVKRGRQPFASANCQSCHGGKDWTSSIVDFTPPPAASEIVDAQLVRFLCRVGTLDAALLTDGVSNEIRANNVANVQARGSLGIRAVAHLGVRERAPYLHSGAAPTLDAVLQNVTHRSAGTGAWTR